MGRDGKIATGLGRLRDFVSTTKRRVGRIFVTLAALLLVIDTARADGPAHLLKDINPTLSSEMGSFPQDYHKLGNITLFMASTHSTGYELWRTDGTEAGTFLVKDIWPGQRSGIVGLDLSFDTIILGAKAFFLANVGVPDGEL